MIIGVTGIIGSGKSTAAKLLAEHLHARVIDADELGHRVLAENKFVRLGLRIVFGSLQRPEIAGQAFASPLKLFCLNKLTHPFIRRLIFRELRQKNTSFILDAPLLFPAGLAKYCDRIIFVTAREALLRRRLTAKGYTPAQIKQRLSANRSVYKYQKQAVSLANNGTLAELRRTICILFPKKGIF